MFVRAAVSFCNYDVDDNGDDTDDNDDGGGD